MGPLCCSHTDEPHSTSSYQRPSPPGRGSRTSGKRANAGSGSLVSVSLSEMFPSFAGPCSSRSPSASALAGATTLELACLAPAEARAYATAPPMMRTSPEVFASVTWLWKICGQTTQWETRGWRSRWREGGGRGECGARHAAGPRARVGLAERECARANSAVGQGRGPRRWAKAVA